MAIYRKLEDGLTHLSNISRGYALLGLGSAGLTVLLAKLYTKRRAVRRLRKQGIPILPHSWLSGHLPILFEFYKDHPGDINNVELEAWLINNRKRLFPADTKPEDIPPVLYLDIWPAAADPLAFICDAGLATQFLAPIPGLAAGITKGPVMKVVLKPLTNNRDLASAEGDEWKIWRARMTPAFSSRNLTALVPEMIDEILVFAQKLEQMVGTPDTDGWGPVFQLWHRTSSLTADVVARAFIDRRLHDQTATNPGGSPEKIAMLDTMEMGKELMTWSGRLSDLLTAGRRNTRLLIKQHKTMDSFLDPAIHAALGLSPSSTASARTSTRSQKKTIVDLACSDKMSASQDTISFIQGTLKVMLFAGFDTTATALCWMFKELQDNPNCLAQLRAEHDQLFGKDEIDPVNSAAEVLRASPHLHNNLPYTTAVIKETLRLHMPISIARQNHATAPSAGFSLVDPSSGQTYPTTGYAMFDGSAWIQTTPDYWPRADEFLPERWLISTEDKHHPLNPTYAGSQSDLYRPFGLGPRQCIGKELAYTEMKLAAALVVRKFDVREAWEQWDTSSNGSDKPKSTVRGQRLYATGNGAAQVKDDMPVQVRLARK